MTFTFCVMLCNVDVSESPNQFLFSGIKFNLHVILDANTLKF